jgi:hypothetical protein
MKNLCRRQQQNVRRSSYKVSDAAFKQRNVKHTLVFSDLNKNRIFSTDFLKYPLMLHFTKILSVRAELFRADGQTDRQI